MPMKLDDAGKAEIRETMKEVLFSDYGSDYFAKVSGRYGSNKVSEYIVECINNLGGN